MDQLSSREIYVSSNGDHWLLVRDADGQVFVQHRAKPNSGGQQTLFQVGEFLSSQLHTPERQHLLEMIGSLVPSSSE